MKLLAVGCVALLGLSMPAFASTGEWGPPRPEILPIMPGAVQVATSRSTMSVTPRLWHGSRRAVDDPAGGF